MKKTAIIFMLSLLAVACSPKAKVKINADPFYDTFYKTARLIMSDEEIEIYKHMPDKEAKAEFIEEFWKKRDTNPETEENEIRAEFQERIDYANRWFREGKASGTGWDTTRGRILLQIGFPDERHWGEVDNVVRIPGRNYGRLINTKRIPLERWIYYRYQLYLQFIGTQDAEGIGDADAFGVFRLIPQTTEMRKLRTALDTAKARLDLGTRKPTRNYFKFEVAFEKDHLAVTVPVKRISFEEKEGMMNAQFSIEIYVYRDYEKIEEIKEKKTVSKDKEELLKVKNLHFTLPYSPARQGNYYFDVIISEELSDSKYRNFCKYKR